MLELFQTHPIMLYIYWGTTSLWILIILEMIVDILRKNKNRNWRDTFSNLIISTGHYFVSNWFSRAVWIGLLYWLSLLVTWSIPLWIWSWIVCLILVDFLFYMMHRCEHSQALLWAFHSVHHSSTDYNFTVARRLSWFGEFLKYIFLIPAILIWFSVFQVFVSLLVVLIYQSTLHTKYIWKLGILEYLFNTPSHHRVHHWTNKQYIDKNYWGMFIIWDRLFGTFQKEEEPVIYGLTKNINTYNPIMIHLIEFKNIYKKIKKTRGFRDKMKAILGKTGWEPEYENNWN